MIAKTTYVRMAGKKEVAKAKTTQRMRMIVGSMPKYSAMPPATPRNILLFVRISRLLFILFLNQRSDLLFSHSLHITQGSAESCTNSKPTIERHFLNRCSPDIAETTISGLRKTMCYTCAAMLQRTITALLLACLAFIFVGRISAESTGHDQLIAALNNERSAAALPTVTFSPVLASVAQLQANYMAGTASVTTWPPAAVSLHVPKLSAIPGSQRNHLWRGRRSGRHCKNGGWVQTHIGRSFSIPHLVRLV